MNTVGTGAVGRGPEYAHGKLLWVSTSATTPTLTTLIHRAVLMAAQYQIGTVSRSDPKYAGGPADPLFDSGRDYLAQIRHYKSFSTSNPTARLTAMPKDKTLTITVELPEPVSTEKILRSLDIVEDYMGYERDHWIESGRPEHHIHVYLNNIMQLRDAIRAGLGIQDEAVVGAASELQEASVKNVANMASYRK